MKLIIPALRKARWVEMLQSREEVGVSKGCNSVRSTLEIRKVQGAG